MIISLILMILIFGYNDIVRRNEMLVTLKSLRVKGEVYSNFYLSYRKVYKTNNSMRNLRLQIILY